MAGRDGAATGGRGGSGGGGGSAASGGGSIDAPITDATGTCQAGGTRPLGAACGCAAECASGFCADGVCCNTACSGACVSCAQPETKGECGVVVQGGADPHNICKHDVPATCGQDGTCNGLGGCAKHKSGTSCGQSSCSAGGLVPASSCDGNGSCLAGSPITCNPSICENGQCKVVCTSNADCIAPRTCNNGSCGPRPLGVSCDTNAQCKSGFCADGVCCDNACTGKCSYCGLSTSLGRCVPVGANVLDPRVATGVTDAARICVDQGTTSCGTTGRCDGSGGCQVYADGTVCRNQTCNAIVNVATPASTCRSGACVAAAPRSCGGFRCSGNRCGTSCMTDGDCIAPNRCLDGLCGKLPLGGPCSRDVECGSAFCTQGVCCNARCNGVCQQCNAASAMGICSPVALGGADPSNTCRDMGPVSCGNDGTCNGAGQCHRYTSGTKCRDASCTNGNITAISMCDGNGMCRVPPATSCGGFQCNPLLPLCLASCMADSQCVAGVPCLAGRCGQSGAGGPCQDGTDCRTGLVCSKNAVCCNTACAGACQTCNTGTCGSIPNGALPSGGGCPINPANRTCGNTGTCDGNGVCALGFPAGSVCDGRCSGNNSIISRCAGGACTASPATMCSPQVCLGSGTCTMCTTDIECGGLLLCVNGSCQAPRTCAGTPLPCERCGTRVCDPRSGTFGGCTGERECNPGATAPCDNMQPGTKTCGASCTFGSCNCAGKVCDSTCIAGADCCTALDCPLPSNACTVNTCVNNHCGTAVRNCADTNACTTDSCDPVMGCQNTGGDCNDTNACTADVCSMATGCGYTPIACNDSNACTTDSCNPGSGCVFTPIVCGDNNACTTDSCNPASGCVFTPIACSDNSACTTDGVCDPATGCLHPPVNCADTNACTADSCDTVMGCLHTLDNCNDNNACTADSCDMTTGCAHPPVNCNDNSVCTVDSCDPTTGCEHTPPMSCDDNDACTMDPSCDPVGGCQHPAVNCNDNNACTTDSCDVATGCEHTVVVCNDNNACTTDSCDPGTGCLSTPISCSGMQVCQGGACVCPAGTPNECSGTCVDFQADNDHCGNCLTVCASPETCQGGMCLGPP